MPITDIIMDFDGTCTQIPAIYEKYLADYLTGLNLALPANLQIKPQDWAAAQLVVQHNSPKAGWTQGVTPAAPAAADPYILSGEAIKYLIAHTPILANFSPPATVFSNAYNNNPAPWRLEAREVFEKIVEQKIRIHFVSNSNKQMIQQRTQDLFGGILLSPDKIDFVGSASKFNITEPDWAATGNWPKEIHDLYAAVPAIEKIDDVGRPVYLHRGNFMTIIADLLQKLNADITNFLFCGDIWELDLGLPAHLGGHIHLIKRAQPFDTYEYELDLTTKFGGKISDDLTGLLQWLV